MPSAVPPSFGDAALRDRRVGVGPPALPIGAALYRWRSAPEPTGVRGVTPPRVRSGGSRVHSPSSSPRFPPATGSLCRRSTGTRPVHSPFFVMWPGVWARPLRGVKPARSGAQPPAADHQRQPGRTSSAAPLRVDGAIAPPRDTSGPRFRAETRRPSRGPAPDRRARTPRGPLGVPEARLEEGVDVAPRTVGFLAERQLVDDAPTPVLALLAAERGGRRRGGVA